jgi:DNA ligase (NAD+)
VNNLADRETLGVRQRDPRWALAYKFEPRRATTKLNDIEVQVGRTGALTPVAKLEAVHIGGVEVRRASLHNQSEIDKKDVRIGDTVLVERAGDVIPQIVKPIKDERDGSEKPFHIPDECPVCGSEVVMSDDKKQARCTNINCPAQVRERIIHYVSKPAMDIEGLGDKRVEQLMNADLLDSISSLYDLEKEAIESLDGYGETSAQNLMDEIEASKDAELYRFLYALGIPLIGEHLARVLARHYKTLKEIQQADNAELQRIDDVGPEVAESIVTFFEQDENLNQIEKIKAAGVSLENSLYTSGEKALPLEGVTFVFTGALERWTRDEVKKKVEDLGGSATSSVSGETDYVVVGENPGSKLDDAKAHDVEIMNEAEFAEFIEGKNTATH